MKLIRKHSQYRRDCKMDIKCQGCGYEQKGVSAYDDRNFWDNVLPKMRCLKCSESTISLGEPIQGIPTKYQEGRNSSMTKNIAQWYNEGDMVKIVGLAKRDSRYYYKDKYIGMEGTLTRKPFVQEGNYLHASVLVEDYILIFPLVFGAVRLKKI